MLDPISKCRQRKSPECRRDVIERNLDGTPGVIHAVEPIEDALCVESLDPPIRRNGCSRLA